MDGQGSERDKIPPFAVQVIPPTKLELRWHRAHQLAVVSSGFAAVATVIVALISLALTRGEPHEGKATGQMETPIVEPANEQYATTFRNSGRVPEYRERRVDRYYQNAHCSRSTSIKWPVTAEEGWQIEVDSVELTSSASAKSIYFGVVDLTPQSFRITGRVSNRGQCVKILGRPVARDARGSLSVNGTYREVRYVDNSNIK